MCWFSFCHRSSRYDNSSFGWRRQHRRIDIVSCWSLSCIFASDTEEYRNENRHNYKNSDAHNNTSNSNANIWKEKENQVSHYYSSAYCLCNHVNSFIACIIFQYMHIHVLASGEVSGTLAPTHVPLVVDGGSLYKCPARNETQ